MTLKAVQTRASAKPSPPKSPMKPIGSHNGYYNFLLNRIRSQSGRAFRAGGEDDEAAIVATIQARFWSKVNKTDGCWLWTASVVGRKPVQHGQFVLPRIRGIQQHVYAHRFSWELAYGPIPETLQVLHKCDVPRCVRPEHLFLGTQAENLADAVQKGRLDHSLPRTIKLSLGDRLAIFHSPARRGITAELAIRYGVNPHYISLIRMGRFVGSPAYVPRRQSGAQPRGADVSHQARAFHGAGFALEPVAYRQIRIVGEV